jgi:predicted RNA-binding Zn-ribbon protein involved in translation (DUF1610 family)
MGFNYDDEDINCINCKTNFEGVINVSGGCPNCGKKYYWDDNYNGELVLYWEDL